MDQKSMLNTLDRLLEEAKVAILANMAGDGFPGIRWMSPSLVRGREGYLYAITSPEFAKIQALENKPKVMWMVQTKSLDEIISIKGTMEVISNPSLQAIVQEAIGGKLGSFWKLNKDMSKVVILETRIESMEYFKPTQALKESVNFTVEAGA